jgi:hypothetical protein
MQDGSKVYVLPDENAPEPPRAQHKNNIVQVMALAVLARPRLRPDKTRFDGKIGQFFFTKTEPAARNSKKQPAGTMITKAVNVDAVQ